MSLVIDSPFLNKITIDANGNVDLDANFTANNLTSNSWTRKTTDFSATAGNKYKVDANITVTLNSSPTDNDQVWFSPLGDMETTASTIARNGKKIMGLSADMTWDQNIGFSLVYDGTNGDWRLAT